jgi:hypothetical protein
MWLTGGDFDFGIAAWHRPVDGGNNAAHVPAQDRPLGVSKNDNCYSSTGQILLKPDVLVSCHKDFEAFSFGSIKQTPFSIVSHPRSTASTTT